MDKVFYSPIQQCLCQVLQVCKNLTHLTISQFILSADWLIALSHLPALRSVMIGSVSIEDLSVESMIRAGEIPPCSQILTLEIMEPKHEQSRESAGLGIWHLLLILPSLVTLNHTSMRFISMFPDGLIREQTGALFCTLRRLLFSKVNPWDVPDLINWIESRPNRICTLTHVKLEMVWGLPDDIAIAFVESLELAPLQVLSLEGLKTGSLEFIDRIAQLFPDLLGLTLIQRENDRQHKTTMCHWPHPSWEYAIHFRPFRKLRYFGWNFAIPMFAQTAIPLLAYEKIAEGMDPDKLWLDEELWKMLQEDCFHDEQYLAAPFAVHCPTLEVMVLDHGYHPFFCLVSRGERGEISLESEFLSTAGWDLKDWNPRLDLGWSSPAL
ncbi:hypothetical protein VKT23_011475 [Stygiomarasmius scandens]|uniref:Uncharacterized protein n=1 Tax=Marasmiellus scandens TaxID=2682957 RepID=A0ABR1JAY8_9AGAR